MHVSSGTALVVVALVSSIVLLLNKSDRLFPLIATVVAGIEAALVFGVMSLSLAKFRIDVILPALLLVAGAVCWSRSSGKSNTTAATLVTMVGLLQLLMALRLFT
jgi:hypothetical protein